MMNLLIFPNQLIENNELINKADKIYLIEDEIFFTKYKYHKMKISPNNLANLKTRKY